MTLYSHAVNHCQLACMNQCNDADCNNWDEYDSCIYSVFAYYMSYLPMWVAIDCDVICWQE